MPSDDPRVTAGRATVYRLYDVGYEINLAHAAELVAPASRERRRPRRTEAAAIVTPRPPLMVDLAEPSVSAAIFDFGVVSLRLQVTPGSDGSWTEFVQFAGGVHNSAGIRAQLDTQLRQLLDR